MKMRLYLDEDAMAEALVQALTERGIDVATANSESMVFRPDEVHLAHATSIDRVLYSFNVGDYCHIHSQWLAASKSHAGIIVASQQRFSIGEQMRRLLRIANVISAENMQNRIEFLGNWN